jgi:hypothetical protein
MYVVEGSGAARHTALCGQHEIAQRNTPVMLEEAEVVGDGWRDLTRPSRCNSHEDEPFIIR